MAIPFNLPSDDTTLEQYRSIHQLLLDLTAILRSLLARNPEWIRPDASSPNAATNNNNDNNNNNRGNINNNTSSHANAPQNCVHHQHQNVHNCSLQFGLPLSPPNSQPGSPSPFFTSATASSGSVFVLPDVVSSAARTLNELTPHQMVPSLANNVADNVPHQIIRSQQQYDGGSCAPSSHTSRKSKRGTRVAKRKSKPHDLDLGVNARKIPKTASCSCFCDAASDSASNFVDQMHVRMDQHQQQQVLYPDVPTLPDTMPCNCNQSSPSDCRIPTCMHVGEELRKIVECFRSPRKTNGVNGNTISSNDDLGDVKVSSFFTQFGRTMFTAALLVIGWKLLKQN